MYAWAGVADCPASPSLVNHSHIEAVPPAGSCVDCPELCAAYGVTNLQNTVLVITFATNDVDPQTHALYGAAIGPSGS